MNDRWLFKMCLLCGLWLAGAGVSRAQVVINEVMFDPSGSEFFDEYVELYNAGNASVDLTGWRIGDADETDMLVPLGAGMVLAPGQFGLVLDSGYVGHSHAYDPLPEAALLLTVGSATLGRDGLSNGRSEYVLLLSAAGDTVAAMAYAPGNTPGVSEEKIDPLGGDAPGNWTDARWTGGTPGRVNSVSRKDRDLALRGPSEAVYAPWGRQVPVDLRVVNAGRKAVDGFQVTLTGAENARDLAGGFLAAGDSTGVTAAVGPLPSGRYSFRAVARVAGDQDTTNNAAVWTVISGVEPGGVVISEVMAAPEAGAPEWVEVYNRSRTDVDLAGWALRDPSTAGQIAGPALLPAGAYAIVAEDVAHFSGERAFALSSWPRLNDGGDVLALCDATATVVDSVAYPGARRKGVSMERIDLLQPGDVAENWLDCTDSARSTPGRANSVEKPEPVGNVELSVDPNPFETATTITYVLPVSRAHVRLWVYDRAGRNVRVLLDGDEGGGRRQVVWDGRSGAGRVLKPGIYVLYLEAGTPDGALLRARKTVVLARGL